MSDQEDLNINIGSDPSGVESGSKAATAAINKIQQEASSLDRAFRSLKGSIDPLFAAQDKYNSSLAQSSRLLAAGRISEDEYAASVNAATQALSRQAAEQLRGTAVAKQAAEALSTASAARASSEAASDEVRASSSRAMFAAQAAADAKLSASAALEAKTRSAIALKEAQDRLAATREANKSTSSVNRDQQGRFISASTVAADRAASQAEAEEMVRLAQIDATTTAQRARNAQRVATTREEAARRAVLAEQASMAESLALGAASQAAAETAAQAEAALAVAQAAAAQAALRSATEQAVAQEAVEKATEAKTKAALASALAEEAEAKATAASAAADAKKTRDALALEAAERKAAKTEADRVASASRLRAALDPAYAAQTRYNTSVKLANDLAASGHIDDATKVKALTAAQNELDKAMKGHINTAKAHKEAYEGLVLVHELLERRFTRMIPSAMILGQAMLGDAGTAGALGAVMSPLGIAIIAVTVALGGLIFAAFQGSEQMSHLNQSLAVTGQYAGMTANQIDAAAQKIGKDTHTGIGQAEVALEGLTASGRVSGQTMITMGEIIARLAELTHQKASVITSEMVKMADDPTAAMKRLNDQYHFLTPTQEQHIRNLIEEGNKTQAVAELADKFNAALKSEETRVTGLAGAVHSAVIGLGNFWSAIQNIGKDEGPLKRLADIQNQMRDIQQSGLVSSTPELQQGLIKLQKEAAAIKAKLDADATKAHKSQLDQQAIDDRAALDALETSTKTNHEKMLREQQAWRTQAKSLLNNPEASVEDKREAQFRLSHASETDAAIAKKFDKNDMGSSAKGPGQVALWKEQLAEMDLAAKASHQEQLADELAFWQQKLLLTKNGSKEQLAVKDAINAVQKAQAKSTYEDDIADLKEKIESAKGGLVEEGKAWDVYLAKVKSVMGATSKEYKAAEKEYIAAVQRLAEVQARLLKGKEKAAEGPATRKFDETQTNSQLQEGNVDFQHSQGSITDLQAAKEKRAILAQEIQDERAFEDQIYQMKLEELNKELAIPGLAKDKIAEINVQIEELAQTHEDKLQSIRDKGLLSWQKANQQVSSAVMQKWNNTADAITSALGSSLKTGEQQGITFKQTMLNVADAVVQSWIDMGIKNLNTWIKSLIAQHAVHAATSAADAATTAATETAKTGAVVTGVAVRTSAEVAGAATSKTVSLTTALIDIGAAAARGAANTYASISAIPIVGPVLAPMAAAGALAAIFALGSRIFSAEGGWGDVPFDGAQTTLHKKEMVLPAKFAEPLRKTLTSRTSDGFLSAAASAGNNVRNSTVNGSPTFNYQPQHHNYNADLQTMLDKDGKVMRKWFHTQVRNGSLKVS